LVVGSVPLRSALESEERAGTIQWVSPESVMLIVNCSVFMTVMLYDTKNININNKLSRRGEARGREKVPGGGGGNEKTTEAAFSTMYG
jgi:hypothetical protein